MKYCEENFYYESNDYIRIPLNKTKLHISDKRFNSIYSNYKIYEFTNNIYSSDLIKKINNYSHNNKFDFSIAVSINFIQNLIGLLLTKKNGNALLYIHNFLEDK